jgi:hypothetical protein
MVAIIYLFKVKPNQTENFIAAWREMALLIYEYENSLGSRLHKQNDSTYIAYAQWPDESTWKNSGGKLPKSANVYLINNTFHTQDSLGFLFTMWDCEWKSMSFMNNILYDQTKHIAYFHDLGNKPHCQMDWNYNNFHVETTGEPIMVAKELHGQYNCLSIMNTSTLESELNTISGSTHFTFANSVSVNPSFASMTNGGFALNTSSTMIDAGIPVNGFYDYNGIAPDLGAKEKDGSISLSELDVSSNLVLFPNPNAGSFKIRTPSSLQDASVKVYNINGAIVAEFADLNGDEFEIKTNLTQGIYVVHVQSEFSSSVKRLVIE